MPDSFHVTDGAIASATGPCAWFYGAAVLLLIVGVTAAFVQKIREGAVAVTAAKRIASGVQETESHRNSIQRIIHEAQRWEMLGLAAVSLAVVSWGIAAWRREKHRGTWAVIISLLAFFVLLQLLMV